MKTTIWAKSSPGLWIVLWMISLVLPACNSEHAVIGGGNAAPSSDSGFHDTTGSREDANAGDDTNVGEDVTAGEDTNVREDASGDEDTTADEDATTDEDVIGDEDATADEDADSGGPPSVGTCQSYLDAMTPAERAHFDAYSAEARGMEALITSFTEYTTGDILGETSGGRMPSSKAIPGIVDEDQFRALTFELPLAGGHNTGKFALQMWPASNGPKAHNVAMTISPCPGDFRPFDNDSDDPYLKQLCRQKYRQGFLLKGSTGGLPGYCDLPPGQTLYINASLRDMFQEGMPPESYCGGTRNGCGVRYELSN